MPDDDLFTQDMEAILPGVLAQLDAGATDMLTVANAVKDVVMIHNGNNTAAHEKFDRVMRELEKRYPDLANAAMGQQTTNATPNPTPDRFKIHTAAEALEPQPPIEWIVDGIFSAGSVSVLAGDPGSKKSYAMLDACVCVATGQRWLDFETQQTMALFVDEENGARRLSRRLAQCLRGHDADEQTPVAFASLAGFDLRDSDSAGALQDVVTQTGARFVVLDSLVDFMLGGDENSVKDTQPMLHALRQIADVTQSAIVVIHHTGKSGKYRGSSAISGAVDLLLIVEAGSDGAITFRTEKARDVEAVEFAAMPLWFGNLESRFKLDVADVLEAKTANAMSKSQRYVIRYLNENGESGMNDIKGNADTCSESAARQAVYALVDAGFVERANSGWRGTEARFKLTAKGQAVV